MKPDFSKSPDQLIPAIIQDAKTLKVLMLGYMNAVALEATQKSQKVTFYSRSKQRLWTKGEESGNFLNVDSMELDCDQDSLLIYVNPEGPIELLIIFTGIYSYRIRTESLRKVSNR